VKIGKKSTIQAANANLNKFLVASKAEWLQNEKRFRDDNDGSHYAFGLSHYHLTTASIGNISS
jgi:hypothetical protein